MSRAIPASFVALDPYGVAADQPITVTPEGVILANCNYLHATSFPALVGHPLWSDVSATLVPYLQAGTNAYVLRSQWRRRVVKDCVRNFVAFRGSNPGTEAGTVKATLASDEATYVGTQAVAAGASEDAYGFALGQDPAQTRDTIRLYVKNDATGGTLRVHTVWVIPLALTSLSAGRSPSGVVPFDTAEYVPDEPLSVWLRDTAFRNLDLIRHQRTSTVVAWSDDWDTASRDPTQLAYGVTSATATLVARIPYVTGPGQDTLEWSVFGFREGASGAVTLRTSHMEAHGIAGVTQALAALDSSPYAANQHDGGTDLDVAPNSSGEIAVYLNGDGTDPAYLTGINVWVAPTA